MIRGLLPPALFLVIGAALGVGLHEVRLWLAPPFDQEAYRLERLFERADKIACLSVGNSHSMAIDIPALGVPGYHVWSLGQDVFEVESQLHTLLPRLPALETVLFTISYGTFHRDNGASTDEDRGVVRSLFYANPPGYGMIAGDWVNYVKGRLTAGIVHQDHWREVFLALGRKLRGTEKPRPKYRNVLHPDGRILAMGPTQVQRTHQQLVRDARDIVLPRHHRLQQNMLENNPDMAEDTYAAVVRIVQLLEERDIRVIFYTPPYYPPYTAGFDAATREFMQDAMVRLQQEHGVEYHDFSRDEAFVGHPEYYANCDHLGAEGAMRFSRARIRPLLQP